MYDPVDGQGIRGLHFGMNLEVISGAVLGNASRRQVKA